MEASTLDTVETNNSVDENDLKRVAESTRKVIVENSFTRSAV